MRNHVKEALYGQLHVLPRVNVEHHCCRTCMRHHGARVQTPSCTNVLMWLYKRIILQNKSYGFQNLSARIFGHKLTPSRECSVVARYALRRCYHATTFATATHVDAFGLFSIESAYVGGVSGFYYRRSTHWVAFFFGHGGWTSSRSNDMCTSVSLFAEWAEVPLVSFKHSLSPNNAYSFLIMSMIVWMTTCASCGTVNIIFKTPATSPALPKAYFQHRAWESLG